MVSLMTEIYFRDYPDVNVFCLIAKGEIAGHLVAVFYLDETDKWIEEKWLIPCMGLKTCI